MLDSDDYYRSNTNPIHFEASLTNKLEEGDFFIITFHTDSYTLNSAVGCAEGTCTSLTSTPTLLVKAIPTATQVIETIINWEINGLISSPVTVYGQTATITVETWFPINSSASEKIDSGTMTYRLDCASTTLQPYLCKTCAIIGTEVCTSCYTPDYFLFNSTKCTNQCGNLSQY